MDKNAFVLAALCMVFAAATLGCTGCTQQRSTVETELEEFQGIGVIQYGLPVLGAGAPSGTEVVAAGSNAYISLIIRNNAEGSEASNIKISLQNVAPFSVAECGNVKGPSELRGDTEYCPPYQDDVGQPYNTHFIEEMFPDEEVELFWTLQAPDSEDIGNMYYEQDIYYTVEFHYKVTMYQSLMAMTQSEFTRRSSEGKAVTGTSDMTNGEIRIRGTTNEPVRYSTGSQEEQSIVVEYRIANINPQGIPKPGTEIAISLTVPNDYVSIPADIGDWGWVLASAPECNVSSVDCRTWLQAEYDVSNSEIDNIVGRTIVKNLEAYTFRDVNDEYTIYAPLELESGISPSVLSLPFYVRASYDYLLDGQGTGSMTLGVEPRGI